MFDTIDIKNIFDQNMYWGEKVSFSLFGLTTPSEWTEFKFTVETWWTNKILILATETSTDYLIDIYTTSDENNVDLRDAT